MKAFTELYTALDETTKTNRKIEALTAYLKEASPSDAAWAIYFLTGRKPKQLIQTPKVVAWAIEAAKISDWLFAESYDAVGDLAETIALLLPEQDNPSTQSLSYWVEERLLPLKGLSEIKQRELMLSAWQELDRSQRFIWNKLITGAFRVGVSQQLVTRAIAAVSKVDTATIAHRLMGSWEPNGKFYQSLISTDTTESNISRPYPFYLAYPFESEPATLGSIDEWQAEWKWDGIRSQVIKRSGEVFIWSRGEELVTDRFPEIVEMALNLPDGTAIDGEILPWKEANVLSFALLQQRIGRKSLSKKLLADIPVILMAYDLLEFAGEDIRQRTLSDRRELLTRLVCGLPASVNSSFAVLQQNFCAPGIEMKLAIDEEEGEEEQEKEQENEKENEKENDDNGHQLKLELKLQHMPESPDLAGLADLADFPQRPELAPLPGLQDLPGLKKLPGVSASSNETERVASTCQRIDTRLRLSPRVKESSWEDLLETRTHARELNVEGLMLKRLDSPYKVGRQRGDWWKWKVNPYTIDAVLINAQKGSGKRASLFTDYTFGVWDGDALVPIAKAYSGLTDEEIRQVDNFVKQNTIDKFGPVRTVRPHLVFELGFEGIQKSSRHKSGVAVRFPRMLRWRTDKPASEADSLETLKELLPDVNQDLK